jgi:hypothetical protein
MCTNPKNRMAAGDLISSDLLCEDGKLEAIKKVYRCDNYIQAITLRETLKTITGDEYEIEENGIEGWKVVAAK